MTFVTVVGASDTVTVVGASTIVVVKISEEIDKSVSVDTVGGSKVDTILEAFWSKEAPAAGLT